MGPSAIRYAGLDDRLRGLGLGPSLNVETAVAEASPVERPSRRISQPGQGDLCRSRPASGTLHEGMRPLVLGATTRSRWGRSRLAGAHEPGGVLWTMRTAISTRLDQPGRATSRACRSRQRRTRRCRRERRLATTRSRACRSRGRPLAHDAERTVLRELDATVFTMATSTASASSAPSGSRSPPWRARDSST